MSELSRTVARRGVVVHVTIYAEPRSGLGLNEWLGTKINWLVPLPWIQ